MLTIDARGLSCPEPVMRARSAVRALTGGQAMEVLVDTVTARDNVTRMAEYERCIVEAEPTVDGFRLRIRKPGG